jgi:hypothetical protein
LLFSEAVGLVVVTVVVNVEADVADGAVVGVVVVTVVVVGAVVTVVVVGAVVTVMVVGVVTVVVVVRAVVTTDADVVDTLSLGAEIKQLFKLIQAFYMADGHGSLFY